MQLNSWVGGDITILVLYVFVVTGSYFTALLSENFLEKPFIEIGRKIIVKINNVKVLLTN